MATVWRRDAQLAAIERDRVNRSEVAGQADRQHQALIDEQQLRNEIRPSSTPQELMEVACRRHGRWPSSRRSRSVLRLRRPPPRRSQCHRAFLPRRLPPAPRPRRLPPRLQRSPHPLRSPPTVYTGRGDDVVSITKDPGPAIPQIECTKCSSNTIVKSDGYDSLLVNTIGSYSGRHLIDIRDGSTTTTATVKATGNWKMTVASGLSAARVGATDAPVASRGDDIVIMNGSGTKARFVNKGQSNLIVHVVPIQTATINLAINTIGSYEGTVPLDAPAIVIIRSSGNWTITPS